MRCPHGGVSLELAVGGGAFAIAKGTKINGAKLKKRSVPAAKLKKHTITGTEVNLNKLGKVPTAVAADTATSATSATNAASVSTLVPPTTVKSNSTAASANYGAGLAAATAVTVYQDSHFRIYGKCFVDESGPSLFGVLLIETKQSGAIFDADEDELAGDPPDGYLNTDTPESERELQEISTSPGQATIEEPETYGATAADGYALVGDYQISIKNGALATGDGPYGPGQVCLFSGFSTHG